MKPICYAPFIGMYADYTGQYAPCCVSKKIAAESLEEFWTSSIMQNMRQQLLNQEWPDECNYCKTRFEKNLDADNVAWDKVAKRVNNLQLDINQGNTQNSPLILDIRPGNKCNLKCRMCGPKFSNLWETEIQENPTLKKWLSLPNIENNRFAEFIQYSDKLDLLQIKILGGEPTIDENVLQFLENMISKKAQLPQLNFTTNGTNLNKRFQDIMNAFESIHITFSVDAVEKEFEYIRTNASWKKVEKNIKNIFTKDLATIYSFNTILMPYNVFTIKNLLSWYVDLYNKGYYFSLCIDTSEAPHTSLSAVLPEDIEFAITDLEEYSTTVNPKFFNEIEGSCDFLTLLKTVKYNKKDYEKFKDYNNLLDNTRKTSLLSLNERFSKYV